ncbi:MAG: tyrosine--tRNA ligase, partial [Treponema sp.]|nr:tyrosine--tRNA ligase [Treponema sp.]
DFSGLSVADIKTGMKSVPSFEIKEEATLIDILVNNKIASSRREAREFLGNKAISVNGNIETDENKIIGKDCALGGEIIIIRRGKKKYYLGMMN